MKGRKQKIFEEKTCPQKNRTASEGYVGGQTFMWITENNLTDNDRVGYGMLERILSSPNLNTAYLQVKAIQSMASITRTPKMLFGITRKKDAIVLLYGMAVILAFISLFVFIVYQFYNGFNIVQFSTIVQSIKQTKALSFNQLLTLLSPFFSALVIYRLIGFLINPKQLRNEI